MELTFVCFPFLTIVRAWAASPCCPLSIRPSFEHSSVESTVVRVVDSERTVVVHA